MLAFLALLGAPYIYDISSLRVNQHLNIQMISVCWLDEVFEKLCFFSKIVAVIKFFFLLKFDFDIDFLVHI